MLNIVTLSRSCPQAFPASHFLFSHFPFNLIFSFNHAVPFLFPTTFSPSILLPVLLFDRGQQNVGRYGYRKGRLPL